MQAVSLWLGAGLQHGQGGIVVGLLADFGHELGMQHFVVFIQYHHGAGGEAAQRGVGQGDAVVGTKAAAETGERYHVFNAFRATEAGKGEGQVGGNAQHHGVLQRGGALVESAHGLGAHTGVDAGENVEHFAFTGEVGQGFVGQIDGGESEGGSGGANGGQVAYGVGGRAAEGDVCHFAILFLMLMKIDTARRRIVLFLQLAKQAAQRHGLSG